MNNTFSRIKKSRGFSLIEMLVVIVLFSLLAFLVTQSTLQSFRGTRKADASGKVRDNLDFAASVVERHLRNAKLVTSTCTGTPASAVSYIDQEGRAGSFSCAGSSATQYLASGSANLRVTSSDINLMACSFTCSQTTSINPPIIDYTFSGVAAGVAATDVSFTTISRRVVLRVY